MIDLSNPNVRKVITPDGIGEFEMRIMDQPDMVIVKIKIGDRKIADYKRYPAEKCEEAEK